MHYTLHQLEVFLKVVEKESVTLAAEELHMTQPAVSIQLKNFQGQFDIPMTEVIRKKLYVTDFGREIAVIASKILNEVDELNLKTHAYKGLLAGTLKIASASTGKYVLPYILSSFTLRHQEVDLILDVNNKTKVIHSLLANEIDFALVSTLPTELEVEEELLLDNKLYLVSGQQPENKTVPLIYREKGSATRAAMEEYFNESDFKRQKKIELTSNEAVKQAVIAGLGRSIVPLIGIKNELLNGDIKIVKSGGLPLTTKWRFIWLKNKKLSPVAKAFLDYIRENKNVILKEKFQWYMTFID